LQKKFSCYETQQLILGTAATIWWVTEPHSIVIKIVKNWGQGTGKMAIIFSVIFYVKMLMLILAIPQN